MNKLSTLNVPDQNHVNRFARLGEA